MTSGNVIDLQARIDVIFRLPHQDVQIEFIIDTGFEGALALPIDAVVTLGLPFYQEIDANLANNANVSVDAYRATIIWQGKEYHAAVLAMGQRPLLGTALLAGYEFMAQFVENGLVSITPM